ncbi:MAG: hypothetical protein LBI18_00425 [Planctomycetaceae bacterium]|jgi:hypothetical protein|nr:hypothetical protein [Planctomycetaceae bacterium]
MGNLSFQVGDLLFQVGDLSFQVGDLSPKGRVGVSRLDPVLSRQLDSKPLGNTNCRPKTESELPNGNATFRRKVAHLKRKIAS